MNKYYEKLKHFQKTISFYTQEIFKVYGYELKLKLEDYNLLTNDDNCIESSTAIGYIIEEFLVSKLEIYTRGNLAPEYVIHRTDGSTTMSSYDCYSMIDDIKALINIKVNKGANNAVSAINKLYDDYVIHIPEQNKCFLVFKVHYHFDKSKDGERKIFIDIDKLDSFFLEEIDFSFGHRQDNRNWTNEPNANSGRLQITDKYRHDNKLKEEDISCENTRNALTNIFKSNLS